MSPERPRSNHLHLFPFRRKRASASALRRRRLLRLENLEDRWLLAGDLSPEDDATDVALNFSNDAPIVVGPVDDVTVDEDAADTVIDMGVVFDDPDLPLGDSLTYTATVSLPIDSLVAQVSQTNYTTMHQDLLYTHTGDDRGLNGAEHDLARDNISSYFAGLGLDTSLESFVYNSQTYYNVVGVHSGVTRPNDIYLIGAHYDSVDNPGADDNGSGVAAMMELARVMTQYEFDATLVFVAFDREEQGLHGSIAYATSHLADNILGMLSVDMIAYNIPGTGHDTVRFYDWNGNGVIKSDLAAAFDSYSGGLTTLDSGAESGSDHFAFELLGSDAAVVIEYAVRNNPYYHTAGDAVESPDYIDYQYATKVTRGVMGYLATAAGLPGSSDLLTATVSGSDLILDYAADASGIADIRVRATDSRGLFVEDMFRVTVRSVNDAPQLDNSGQLHLAAIDAGDVDNSGTLVRDILASAGGAPITDTDAGALEGIAVVGVDNAHGIWQYSLRGGDTWSDFGTPAATSARLLGADSGTRIRFVPDALWSGTVDSGIGFRAWDHTQGFNGASFDASVGGGDTAFSGTSEDAAITVHALGSVVDRHIFYNNAYYDGNNPAANTDDFGAIVPHTSLTGGHGPHATGHDEPTKELGKDALLPGQTATSANTTSFYKGINGIMVDIAGLGGTPTAADFEFKIGNNNDPSTWADAPAPTSITVFADAGTADGLGVASDRITIIWPDNAIEKEWLQITVLATANTALGGPDVFYFGNAIGDSGSGNTATFAFVTVTDELAARNHPHDLLNRALVSDPSDYDKDSFVTVSDELIARNNGTNFLNALKLITVPASAGVQSGSEAFESSSDLRLERDGMEHALLTHVAVAPVDLGTDVWEWTLPTFAPRNAPDNIDTSPDTFRSEFGDRRAAHPRIFQQIGQAKEDATSSLFDGLTELDAILSSVVESWQTDTDGARLLLLDGVFTGY